MIDRQRSDTPLQNTIGARPSDSDLAMQIPSLPSNANPFSSGSSRSSSGFDTGQLYPTMAFEVMPPTIFPVLCFRGKTR